MITVPRTALAAELSLLLSVISKYATLPIQQTIRFDAGDTLRLTASSIDVALTTEIPLPGLVNEPESYCLPAKSLGQLVSLFDKDEVTFEQTDNGRVKVQCGRSKHLLPRHNVSDFPEPDRADMQMATISGETFAAMLKHTAFAVFPLANDVRQSDSKFTGLHFTLADGTLTIAATNKLRLAIARTPVTGAEFAVIAPQQIIPALKRFNSGTVEIGANDNLMIVRAGSRQLTSRLLVDKPLDWAGLFPKSYEHVAEADSGELAASLRRALVTSAEQASFVVNGLKWSVGSHELLIESRDGDDGKSDEVLPITCPTINGDTITLGVNGGQVVDYLSLDVAGEKTRIEITPNAHVFRLSPVTPQAFEYEYLVNTVGLKW